MLPYQQYPPCIPALPDSALKRASAGLYTTFVAVASPVAFLLVFHAGGIDCVYTWSSDTRHRSAGLGLLPGPTASLLWFYPPDEHSSRLGGFPASDTSSLPATPPNHQLTTPIGAGSLPCWSFVAIPYAPLCSTAALLPDW